MPRSTSTAVTAAPVAASATVSEPRPAPISTHVIAGTDPREPGDALDGVRVGHEVLAERLRGVKAVLAEQAGHLARGRAAAGPGHAGAPLRRSAISAPEPEGLLGVHPADGRQDLGLEALHLRDGVARRGRRCSGRCDARDGAPA